MNINIYPQIGDGIPQLIWNAHEIGSMAKTLDSHPCSLCRSESDEIHFHGSNIGECARKVHKRKLTKTDGGISKANFLNDGHLHEHSMLTNVEAGLPDGYSIHLAKNSSEKIFNAGEFNIVTHLDAVLLAPDALYGVECKSVKQAMWKKIREEQEIPDEWYGQVQGYMLTWEQERWYIFVKNRETSQVLMPIRIDRDISYIAERLNKLREIKEYIISGDGQPDREHSNPKAYECLWCPFGNNIGDGSCWQTK